LIRLMPRIGARSHRMRSGSMPPDTGEFLKILSLVLGAVLVGTAVVLVIATVIMVIILAIASEV
jgi:hypothetical protein